MGNVCKKRNFQYKLLIESVYPKNKDGDMGDTGKLTMYCITNPDQLPVIGNRLEKRIKQDMAKHNINFVIIGCKALDAIILTCHSDLSLFIVNIVNIINFLFSQDDYRLKIQATETMNRAVQYFNDQPFRQLISFIPILIQMMTAERSIAAEAIALKIAAMRTISKMVTVMDLQQIENIQKIIQAVVGNMKSSAPAQPRTDYVAASDVELVDTQSKVPPNLLDRNALQQLRPEHVEEVATETLGSISRANSIANVRIVMKPILDTLDQAGWEPFEFVQKLFTIIINTGSWAQQYILALELIRHARDVKDKNRNRNVLRAVSFVISTQNRKAAVPRALETLSSLYNLLLSENDKEMQMLIIQAIETIAKTGQHTPQNIDLIMAMLSALKKKDVPEELLLDAILAVSSYSCYVQAGRNYPDVLVKTLLDEAVSRPPRSRAIILAILQKLVKTQKRNIVSTTEDEAPQANTTLASLSKKQQKELHYCLHRSSALKDNEPQNYVRIYRTLRTLWKRYRNADIAESVPMILTLQAAAKEMEGAQARAIHTLCAAYFTLLVHAYNNNDLGKYVSGIIEARLESKQINKNFVTLISKVNAVSGSHMSSASGVSVDSVVIDIEGSPVDRGQRKKQRDDWYTQLEQIFTFAKDDDQPVASDNLFDKDKIVDLLSKIESLQSSLGEDITEILSKNFSGDMSVSQPKPELEDEPRWDNNLDEGTDTSVNEAPDNIHEEIPSEKAIDFEKHSFADIGQNASAKTQKMTQALDEILALVPASEGDQDHSLISEIEEEENIEGDAEGEVREMVGEKGKQKGRVMQHVPKLYLFDAPEYVM